MDSRQFPPAPPSLLSVDARTMTLTLHAPVAGMQREVSYAAADDAAAAATATATATWSTFMTAAATVRKKGFEPNSSYIFRMRVRAAETDAWSPHSALSAPFSTMTLEDAAKALTAPPALSVAEAEALTWVWQTVDGAAAYALEWREEANATAGAGAGASWTALSSMLKSTAVRKKNLTSGGAAYRVRVRAQMDDGSCGPWSTPSAPSRTLAVSQPFKNLLGTGHALVSSRRERAHIDSLGVPAGRKKLVALYFSAHWCPPCRAFTPRLASAFKSLKQRTAPDVELDVVFVSLDRDEGAFAGYLEEQRCASGGGVGWWSVPWTAQAVREKCSNYFKVRIL